MADIVEVLSSRMWGTLGSVDIYRLLYVAKGPRIGQSEGQA